MIEYLAAKAYTEFEKNFYRGSERGKMMIKLSARTKLSSEDAIKRAVSFFGAGGLGLDLKEQQANCAHFEGGGGVVDVTACADGKGSSLEIAAQEWDAQAKEFVSHLPV